MPRPIQATIHTQALRHNLQTARARAPDARTWAVVKDNAYGHGIEHVFAALAGADGFALLDIEEARRLLGTAERSVQAAMSRNRFHADASAGAR